MDVHPMMPWLDEICRSMGFAAGPAEANSWVLHPLSNKIIVDAAIQGVRDSGKGCTSRELIKIFGINFHSFGIFGMDFHSFWNFSWNFIPSELLLKYSFFRCGKLKLSILCFNFHFYSRICSHFEVLLDGLLIRISLILFCLKHLVNWLLGKAMNSRMSG